MILLFISVTKKEFKKYCGSGRSEISAAQGKSKLRGGAKDKHTLKKNFFLRELNCVYGCLKNKAQKRAKFLSTILKQMLTFGSVLFLKFNRHE